jgi:hypothetical protein
MAKTHVQESKLEFSIVTWLSKAWRDPGEIQAINSSCANSAMILPILNPTKKNSYTRLELVHFNQERIMTMYRLEMDILTIFDSNGNVFDLVG